MARGKEVTPAIQREFYYALFVLFIEDDILLHIPSLITTKSALRKSTFPCDTINNKQSETIAGQQRESC
jgi:hypothetical protein